jgi:putative ABC transport system substrate-binding protein
VRRREFIEWLGSVAIAGVPIARAQQSAAPIIGYLNPGAPAEVEATGVLPAFREGLRQVGYIEGQNVAIEYRFANNDNRALPTLALELTRRNVAVIAAVGGNAPALAAKAATTTIPIVFRTSSDPVELGLVASLSRPGGNMTGVGSIVQALSGKRLQLIREIVPAATTISALVNPTSFDAEAEWKALEAVARATGVNLVRLDAGNPAEIERAFDTLVQRQSGALLAGADAFFFFQREQLVSLAARHVVPAIYHAREAVEAGGLMSYGPSNFDGHRLAGVYVGRILRGERPAQLPVEQSTRIEMFLNLKTAKALGLTITETLLATADKVIE